VCSGLCHRHAKDIPEKEWIDLKIDVHQTTYFKQLPQLSLTLTRSMTSQLGVV